MQKNKRYLLESTLLSALFSCFILSDVQAAKPQWTFVPQTPTDIAVTKGGSAQVSYLVRNESSRAKTLVMQAIPGVSAAASCILPAKGSCTLALNIDGATLRKDIVGGPILCLQGNRLECYQPSSANSLRVRIAELPILFPFKKDLTLSINSPTADPALAGNARIIRITNTGSVPATNLKVSHGAFPDGTIISANTCIGELSVGATCDITITPGNRASLDNANTPCTSAISTEPVPTQVSVHADNALTANINVLVLGYGCRYQSGFLFSVDESTSATESVGGKVAAFTDEEGPVFLWATVLNATGATSINDGTTNTKALLTPVNQYPAAQACARKGSSWYLPAICELGRFSIPPGGINAGCGTTNPNLYSTLMVSGLGGFNTAYYWSSTEASALWAWNQLFGNGFQDAPAKNDSSHAGSVRCVKAIAN